jgi:hypothetical protein
MDQGGEYILCDLVAYFASQGIEHVTTPSYTPEFNGVAEKFNCTILGIVCSLLKDTGLEHKFWGEALHTATVINN